jgi:hypothetical protein
MDIANTNLLAAIAFSLVMILALLTYVILFRDNTPKKKTKRK